MDELSVARVLLTESEFHGMVMADTAALAVDMVTGRIVYATDEAERMFACGMKNELIGEPYERLIPSEIRERHSAHAKIYLKNPKSRSMGASTARLRALTLDGSSIDVVIGLRPIKKRDRVYQILTFQRLPK